MQVTKYIMKSSSLESTVEQRILVMQVSTCVMTTAGYQAMLAYLVPIRNLQAPLACFRVNMTTVMQALTGLTLMCTCMSAATYPSSVNGNLGA